MLVFIELFDFKHLGHLAALCGLGLVFLNPTSAHAIVPNFSLGFEGDASRDVVDPAFFPILSAGFNTHSTEDESMKESSNEYNADLLFRISPTHPDAFAITSRNFYLGEKDEDSSALHFSFGRRLIGWTKLDEIWQLGSIEPLDSWDRLRSESQGLTGLFVYAENSIFDFRLFLSYLTIPETTPNVVIKNGQFVADHPQATTTAPQSFNLLDQSTPLGYQLNVPSIDKIIFRPSIMLMMETKHEYSFFGKFVYGYLPLNYFPIALQASLSIPNQQITVPITPRLLQHHVYNAETGYRFSEQLNFGIAELVDAPVSDSLPDQYTATQLTTSYTTSPYIQLALPNVSFTLSQIWTTGGLGPDFGPEANPNSSLFSSRILYRNATQVATTVQLGDDKSAPSLQVKYIHEYSILADWIATDLTVHVQPSLTAFIGGDIISAQRDVSPDRGAEFLADMRVLDRIRFGASYAF